MIRPDDLRLGDDATERTESLGRLLRRAVMRNPERCALTHRDASLTRRQLWAEIERAAKSLIGIGISPGDRVATWSSAVPETIIIQWAAALCGVVVVRLAGDLDEERAYSALEATAPRRVFVEASFEGRQYPSILRSLRASRGLATEVVVHGRIPRFERVLPGGWMEFLDAGAPVTTETSSLREAEVMGEPNPVAICFSGNSRPVEVTKNDLLETGQRWRSSSPSARFLPPMTGPAELITTSFAVLLGAGTMALRCSDERLTGQAAPDDGHSKGHGHAPESFRADRVPHEER